MIKVDIVNEVSKAARITKVKAEVAVDAVFDAMRVSMQRGERIELRGFGVFQVKPRKRGIGRNPRTGKEVRIPPGRTIRFRPGKDLAEAWPPPAGVRRTPCPITNFHSSHIGLRPSNQRRLKNFRQHPSQPGKCIDHATGRGSTWHCS